MSDDSDLLIAAAATAAVFTWIGARAGERGGSAARPAWRVRLRAIASGVARCWRETPGYRLVAGIRDAFFRRR
jgi:hypothetical protein